GSTITIASGVISSTAAVPSTSPPLMDGIANAGLVAAWSRGDHVHPSDVSRLANTGGTLTGNVTISLTDAKLELHSATPSNRMLVATTAGANRWAFIVANSGAEGGGNAGSDFNLTRYTDAGAFLDNPVQVYRASGQVVLPHPLNVNGGIVGVTDASNATA